MITAITVHEEIRVSAQRAFLPSHTVDHLCSNSLVISTAITERRLYRTET